MEISFTRKDFSCLLIQNKLLWKELFKWGIGLISTLLIVGGLCMLDVIDRYSKTGSFGGITFSIALALLLPVFIILPLAFLIRAASTKKIQQVISLYTKQNASEEYKLNGWGIFLKGVDVNSEISWAYFEKYRDYGDYLVLSPKNPLFQEFVFHKSEMPGEVYNELLEFLKKRYPPNLAQFV